MNRGAYQEGIAAGYLNGPAARNPYRALAMSTEREESAMVDLSSDWESGKVQGLIRRNAQEGTVAQ